MPDYQFPMFARLEPHTEQFRGGRITDIDMLTLEDAAKYACRHAGTDEITPADFLRAAARGEITLRAIVHREAKLQKYDGGVYCNQGTPAENTVPKNLFANLPLSACRQLANVGNASWRTFDGFEQIGGELMRFTVATLLDSEPDFQTVLADCRVTGDAVHALADAFIDTPDITSGAPENASKPSPARGEPKHVIMAKFDGLHFDSDHWSRNLASVPAWLRDCQVARGDKNRSGLWNPALVAAALHDKGVPLKKLDAVFVSLREWANEWAEVSAIFRR